MKPGYLLFLIAFTACTANQTETDQQKEASGNAKPDASQVTYPADTAQKQAPAKAIKTYANERFRNVTVEKAGENKYRISGQGQIFEASFSWVIEDGHNELKQGHEMTDAGAPEWGNFSFVVEAKKEHENSTLHLILFEISAKDGSRVHELPILLE